MRTVAIAPLASPAATVAAAHPTGTGSLSACARLCQPAGAGRISVRCVTERRAILSGSTFEEQIGYARAVVDGDWVHVSGTSGFDYTTMTISGDVVEQARQCLRNIETALAQANCTFADVVRVRYMLPDRADFEPCWPLLRRCFGEVRPAATMIVCGLADARMKIEVEVYARRHQ
jgi:enamine deaminase RidA (YjgF/YER057c/UK114 family)